MNRIVRDRMFGGGTNLVGTGHGGNSTMCHCTLEIGRASRLRSML